MKYSVGEVAKLLGITPNALRFYEDEGVIKTRREKNGRRFYNQSDITRLLSCKKYSSMGVPLKIIAQQFSEGGDRKEAVTERLVQCEREARERSAFYQNLADNIATHIDTTAQIKTRYGEIRIETSPECLILFDRENQLMTHDNSTRKQIRNWISAMPATKLACVYLSDDIHSGHATLAYSIFSDMAKRAGLDMTAPNIILAPPRPSLHIIFSHSDIFTKPESAFSTVFPYMQEKGLHVDGTPWAQFIVVESNENYTHRIFVDVWVPFKL